MLGLGLGFVAQRKLVTDMHLGRKRTFEDRDYLTVYLGIFVIYIPILSL